jgi:hypothetical protein
LKNIDRNKASYGIFIVCLYTIAYKIVWENSLKNIKMRLAWPEDTKKIENVGEIII